MTNRQRSHRIGCTGLVGALSTLYLFLNLSPAEGQQVSAGLRNQLSGQGTVNFNDPPGLLMGMRAIPSLDMAWEFGEERKLDAECSVNGFWNVSFSGEGSDNADHALDPYRLWLRYSTPRLEIRAGLQKISFGSASIFRPLMWFDKQDYRDPLQLTQGVYGLLGRYYFRGNVNIWLWGLYGNKGNKGWELVPTRPGKPEFGGRLQLPLFTGEIALSYHHRQADFTSWYALQPVVESPYFNQDYIGVDGKWDVEAGIWFEYVLRHNEKENLLAREFEHYLNVGSDYTFGLGNGLNLTAEYFRYQGLETSNYLAMAANYPFGLMNRVIGAVYYQWDERAWYRFVSFQREYDYWSVYLIGFWNPRDVPLTAGAEDRKLFAGRGIQAMVSINF